MSAILRHGTASKEAGSMTRNEEFAAQFNYCATLSIANRMFAESLLTRQEYSSIKKMLINRYNPPIKLTGVEPPKNP
jgi:hypothetical protein